MTDKQLLKRVKELNDLMMDQPIDPVKLHEYDYEFHSLTQEMEDRGLTMQDLPA